MLIKWAKSAQADLLEILTYITAQEDTEAAEHLARRIFKKTKILSSFPLSGKPGKIAGTRELHLRSLPYFIVYQESKVKEVTVTRIIHKSRLWPEE